MRTPALVLPLALALAGAAFAPRPLGGPGGSGGGDPAPLRGFGAASSRAERAWEEKLRAIPDPARMREAMRRLSARPHHVGSPYDRENAEWMAQQFRSWGWDAAIERFDVLFPTPLERRLELVAPTTPGGPFRAALAEPPVPGDSTAPSAAEQLPPYNAYGGDGDVTAPLVYVNYGVPDDYEELARRGISVKGAIVLARYGGSWRGIKPKVAAEHGAVGCIIFSDPRDDGYAGGAVFPRGPMRPPAGVQRGSVLDMPVTAGDPLTPGVAATKSAKRLAVAAAPTIMRIPVLPISYADARPLLEALEGPVVPEAWRGALPLTYRFGGTGPARAHLVVKSDWSLEPIYDVIARLPGTTEADQWVVRGNHHDAWVNGAEDPISGLVAELEEARALGELYRAGWRPKRTIVYAAWDGEEPGLLGSTEWVEAHADELARHAVAYLNTDTNGRGFFGAGGSHTLETFVDGVARDVTDPETHASAWRRSRANALRTGTPDEREALRGGGDLRLDALGSGSDFTPFLQHAGVASLNFGYGGEDDGGIYHSAYDDFYWFTHFSDTAFVYGRALAQTAGIAVMRLAGADVLPYRFTSLAATAGRYVKELKDLRDERAKTIDERGKELDDGTFAATSDPRSPTVAPARLAPAPHLNFAALENAVDSLARAADRYERAYARWAADSAPADPARLRALNERLLASERLLTSPAGLPGRPWYRHLLYAPGLYTGYGVKTMPAVREAIEQGRWAAVDGEAARVAAALNAEAEAVGRMADMLHP